MSFENFSDNYCQPEGLPIALDLSRMNIPASFLLEMEPRMQSAFDDMEKLEAGAVANPDEGRMVGHYWLRNFDLLPNEQLRELVKSDYQRVVQLLADIIGGKLTAKNGEPFKYLLSIGIGGSALGPQFIAEALTKGSDDKLQPIFLDNTDPEGIARAIAKLGKANLARTLVLVISKSGGTPETRNGMLLAEEAFKSAGLEFGAHAIAITGDGSKLDNYAKENKWLDRLPMYDWVGGRTSLWSAVGLMPAGLQGIDIDLLLKGAAAMDTATRARKTQENPAALLALAWFHATNGCGEKDMVVIPYKDSLALLSRYLQQLIMESLGKEKDLEGKIVEQGIAVYGNKGSTDQHAYVQQLREGVNNFFVTFIQVLQDGGNSAFEVEEQVTAGDYLLGFLLGTQQALSEKNRTSATLVLSEVNAFSIGALLALYERAVGFYASLVNINAYHQPGVEAGKKAAAVILDLQRKLLSAMKAAPGTSKSAKDWAREVNGDAEGAFKILQHLAANGRGIAASGRKPAEMTFVWKG